MHNDKHIAPLLAALTIALIPHIPRLSLWVTAWCFISWGYILAAIKYRFPRPGKITRLLLTIGGLLAVLLSSGFGLDRNSSIGLLWIMASIKPMEIRTYRDEMVTVFLTYFLAVACLFFSSSLSIGLYVIFSVCMTTAVLIHLHHPRGPLWHNLGVSAKLLLKALPLAVILFIAFPRVQGSLWGLRSPAEALSGFTDRLSPGSVSRLVRSNDIVFRAEFKDRIPAADHLYWRGLVFWQFDGQSWRRSNNTLNIELPIKGHNAIEYTVTLEPHHQKWLFALDLPDQSESNATILSDNTLNSHWTVRQRIRYRVKSLTSYNTGPLREWETFAVRVPLDTNPDAVTLAGKWRTRFDDPSQIVATALQFFRENDFAYTLNPPPLGERPIDEFLFKTRRGYCEHYASAFAFLMRAANVPARIVAGYLGGELNPYGDYLIVRQSDAHAWVEVWLPGKGWARVDPTSAVAPERVEGGMAAALPPDERSSIRFFTGFGPLSRTWNHFLLGWDAVNNQWNRWVLGYSNLRQKVLFSKIGIKSDSLIGWTKALFLAAASTSLIALFYFTRIFERSPKNMDAVQDAYLTFCAKLDAIGLARKPSQGPLDYAEKLRAVRDDLTDGVFDIINLYIYLRYGGGCNKDGLKRLKILVKQFNP
jgi:transglutaminase-like putative cysteine protease